MPVVKILLAVAVMAVTAAGPGRAQERVDLELVLAVDASASVSADEFQLQMDGIASAFRDPAVHRAIASGPLRRIAVLLVVWAGAGEPKRTGDWFAVETPGDAAQFATSVATFGRQLAGGTGIGDGVLHSIDQILNNRFEGTRRIVDVSGDGRENLTDYIYLVVAVARQRAINNDITINGLAILTNDDKLDQYYRREVATGPGNFVMSASSYQDFSDAIKKKLLREIGQSPVARVRPAASPRSGHPTG